MSINNANKEKINVLIVTSWGRGHFIESMKTKTHLMKKGPVCENVCNNNSKIFLSPWALRVLEESNSA